MKTNITIQTGTPRFGGVGDWPDYSTIVVKAMPDWRFEFLVGLHELVEATICKQRGVTAVEVDAWDAKAENADLAGEDARAPYHQAHLWATEIELRMAVMLEVDLDLYDKACRMKEGD
jgi:hypothetical protein